VTALLAHGLTGRADLPIPAWLFAWAASAVLVVSFVSLAALWHAPFLERYGVRPLPYRLAAAVTSTATEFACGMLGVAGLVFLVIAGLAGVQSPADNVVPTFVYVIFWVGLVFLSVLAGDVFRAFNPWRAIGRATGWIVARTLGERAGAAAVYPEWLGHWPAAAGLFAFAWLELLAPNGVEPRTIAAATLVYSSLTFVGMGVFGVETWSSRGEAFGVYFGLFAGIAPLERRGRDLVLRPPLAGLTRVAPLAGSVALLAVMIGSVTFDGLQETSLWGEIGPPIADFFASVGAGPSLADELAGGVGLLATVAILGGFYLLGIAGASTAGGGFSLGRLAGAFVFTLVPIALVYVMSHYLTFLLFQGQAMWYLVSDPLGRDWDLFGTFDSAIDYGLIGATATWYVQVALVVVGHASGLTLAHDRALVLYDDPRAATRSQLWMLGVMIGFTCLALWLLSQANA
jgi:hypothetical protein